MNVWIIYRRNGGSNLRDCVVELCDTYDRAQIAWKAWMDGRFPDDVGRGLRYTIGQMTMTVTAAPDPGEVARAAGELRKLASGLRQDYRDECYNRAYEEWARALANRLDGKE